MASLGMFAQERVELVYGARRAACIRPRAEPFIAGDRSLPEPDVAVVPRGDYRDEDPTKALLLVEVADSSLDYDRTTKAKLYAESGVPEYWIVNLVDGLIEVHSDIIRGVYTRVVPYRRGDRIVLLELSDISLAVGDLL